MLESKKSVVTPPTPLDERAEKAQHLDALLRILEPEYRQNVHCEELLHLRGVTSFEGLWLLFKPGSDVYAKIDGELSGFVIHSVEKRHEARGAPPIPPPSGSSPRIKAHQRWIVTVWNLGYAGQMVTKQIHRFPVVWFPGEREIISLPIFPSKYHDEKFNNVTRLHLEERGAKYWECAVRIPAHMKYNGTTLDRKPKQVRPQTLFRSRVRFNFILISTLEKSSLTPKGTCDMQVKDPITMMTEDYPLMGPRMTTCFRRLYITLTIIPWIVGKNRRHRKTCQTLVDGRSGVLTRVLIPIMGNGRNSLNINTSSFLNIF